MRTLTEKDKRGLLVALRVFLRNLNGERLSKQAGIPLIEKALEAGLTVDQLLNKENWGRAAAICPELNASDYIDILCERKIDIKAIKEEEMWDQVEYGFALVAEMAHDFYLETTGIGGKWNIPSALSNLADVIREYSLQAIMSEQLINQVLELKKTEEVTYFIYVKTILNHPDWLEITNELTLSQTEREEEDEKTVDNSIAESSETEETEEETEEPDPLPEEEGFEEGMLYPDFDQNDQMVHARVTQNNPNDTKKQCLRIVLSSYKPSELLGLLETIDGAMEMTIEEILNCLVYGKFDPKKESAETKHIHEEINADLTPSYITCVQCNGIEMDEEAAAERDLLAESWDLRSPDVRKYQKLLKLITTKGNNDPDLLDAITDIENLYMQ